MKKILLSLLFLQVSAQAEMTQTTGNPHMSDRNGFRIYGPNSVQGVAVTLYQAAKAANLKFDYGIASFGISYVECGSISAYCSLDFQFADSDELFESISTPGGIIGGFRGKKVFVATKRAAETLINLLEKAHYYTSEGKPGVNDVISCDTDQEKCTFTVINN